MRRCPWTPVSDNRENLENKDTTTKKKWGLYYFAFDGVTGTTRCVTGWVPTVPYAVFVMVLSLMPSRFSASGQAFGSLYTTAQLPQSVNSMAVMAVCHAASPRQKHCEVACTMPRPACLAGQVRLTGKENQKVLSLKTRNLQRKDSPCVSSSTRHLVLARSQLVRLTFPCDQFPEVCRAVMELQQLTRASG